MLFGHHTISKTIDEHLLEIAALASDPQTLVFLDTNILAYLYKLHEAARHEFFAWTDGVVSAGRLVIPAWAASEYLSRVTAKALDSYTPKSKEPAQIKKAMLVLHETASLFVDDPLLVRMGFHGNRTAYLTGFRQAIDALDPYIRAFSHQFDPGVIHQQVVDHLSSVILGSDLAALCARASLEGNSRYEHRLPPGFRDREKEENRFGDLIIWFEILDKAAECAVQFPKVLFITNDEKSDWVYTPKMRNEVVAGARKVVGNTNPEIKLADPRLVSEFQRRTGHSGFAICSLATLVEGLSKVGATLFAQLAAAIQINSEEAESPPLATSNPAAAESDIGIAPIEPPVPAASAPTPAAAPGEAAQAPQPVEVEQPRQPSLSYELEALQDGQYQADAPSELNTIIRALKSLNWYTQNPAIVSISEIRHGTFSASAWFVLGRNIYQAACGNSQKAMEFMAGLETQLRQFPAENAKHILAGMLFEIYFDAQGQFRAKAKFSYADRPLALVADDTYEDVRAFILFHLHDYRHQLRFLPGERNELSLLVATTQIEQSDDDVARAATYQLRSVTLDGVELMRPDDQQGRHSWARVLTSSRLSQQTLRTLVSEDLAIPRWALVIRFEPAVRADAQFVVPEGQELHPKLALEGLNPVVEA